MAHEVREATADEYPAVISIWVSNFKHSPFAGCIANNEFGIAARATYRGLIARGARVLLAPRRDRFTGFIVTEGDCLHYLYVKPNYRGVGVAKALLAAAEARGVKLHRYSHKTGAFMFLEERGLRWDPVAARTETL